jgi:DMSO/TMAO reductase YedYZ molybdopterin-dependent catalytic subunit
VRTLYRGFLGFLLSIALAIGLLALGVLIIRSVDNVEPDDDDWYVFVHGKVTNETRYRIQDMKSIGGTDVRMALLGTGEDGRTHTYEGIPLSILVQHAAPEGNSTKVTVRAVDSYSISLSMEETMGNGAFLVWQKDGKDLTPRSHAGDGPVRLIVSQEMVGEFNAQHCVKWVSEVILE